MEVKIKLKPEKASEIRKVIWDEFHCPSEGYWDGSANVAEGVYEYTTGTEGGHYTLSEDNMLVFIGYRRSFLSGTMLFCIDKEDVENWEILESKQLGRSPWDDGILNLTQHNATEEQFREGVVELNILQGREQLKKLLTFDMLPTRVEVNQRAVELAELASVAGHHSQAMIGGAPYLMSALERVLTNRSIQPVYAFSQRVSEEKEVDGEVIKTQVFKHLGFVEV